MITEIIEFFKMYLEDHCLIFWHDFQLTGEPVPGMMSSEQWYWDHERCTKCKSERASLRV